MNFTKEHIKTLEKNKNYYETLKKSGALSKVNSSIVAELQTVYNEAIGGKKFPTWCAACVIELVELVYINYENFKNERRKKIARPKSTGK
jgi:abortive infection bacteriophage resistance protein